MRRVAGDGPVPDAPRVGHDAVERRAARPLDRRRVGEQDRADKADHAFGERQRVPRPPDPEAPVEVRARIARRVLGEPRAVAHVGKVPAAGRDGGAPPGAAAVATTEKPDGEGVPPLAEDEPVAPVLAVDPGHAVQTHAAKRDGLSAGRVVDGDRDVGRVRDRPERDRGLDRDGAADGLRRRRRAQGREHEGETNTDGGERHEGAEGSAA